MCSRCCATAACSPTKTDDGRPELRLPGERNGLMMVFRV